MGMFFHEFHHHSQSEDYLLKQKQIWVIWYWMQTKYRVSAFLMLFFYNKEK